MIDQEKQEIQAMLCAIYKKLLELEDKVVKGNPPVGRNAQTVVKALRTEADKIKPELDKYP